MMEPERDGRNFYPWVLYDPHEFYKAWSIQLVPELQIKRSYKNKTHFHVLINVKNISVDEISMKYDKEYLTIQGDYKEKKEQGYECYTAFNIIRRIKLPKGVDMAHVDTWTTKQTTLNILAPIDTSPSNDGQVAIYYPCANSKTVTDIASRTLNCVQEYRFETLFQQLDSNKTYCPPGPMRAQAEKSQPPAKDARSSTGNTRSSAGNVRSSNGNTRTPAGNTPASTEQCASLPRNTRAQARNVNSSAGNNNAPPGIMRAPNRHVRPPAGNMAVARNSQADNVYVATRNVHWAPANMYAPAGNVYPPSGAVMVGPGGIMRPALRISNYNQANYEYDGGSYAQQMYPSGYITESENISPDNRSIMPRRYIYAAEMDPNSINE